MAQSDHQRVFDLMPPVRRAYIWTAFFDYFHHPIDVKSILAIIVAIIAIFSSIGGIFLGIFTFLKSKAFTDFVIYHPTITMISTGSLISTALICSILIYQNRQYNIKLVGIDTLHQYKILHKSMCANIISKNKVNYYNRFLVECVVRSSRIFELNFDWTSVDSSVEIEIISPVCTFIIQDGSHGWSKKLIITFSNPLIRGHEEQIDFVLKTSFEGQKTPDPAVGVAVNSPKYPRFSTFLSVLVDDGVDIQGVYREEHIGSLDGALRSKRKSLNGSRYHEWRLFPIVGRRFRLRWIFGV